MRLAIVTPVFNDSASFLQLCRDIDRASAGWGDCRPTIIAVDDGSAVPLAEADLPADLQRVTEVEVLLLQCNLGHQRAIAVGLAEVHSRNTFDAVAVMDCDGEDRPEDLGRLIEASRAAPGQVIAARRAKRSETLRFKAFYALYKAAFLALTGRIIDFGNFMLIPIEALPRLLHMAESWNHLAATLLRSRLPVRRLPTCRGTRYAGTSSMNVVSLVVHGLSAISVFSDVVFVRLLALSGIVGGLALLMGLVAFLIRIATTLAIPGWATTVIGLSVIILFQALTLLVIASLTMLGSRSAAVFLPAVGALTFVRRRLLVRQTCPTSPPPAPIPGLN